MKPKGLYSKQPVASSKAIADKNPLGTVTVGPEVPKMVPQAPSSIHGLNVPAHSFKGASVKGSHGYGHIAKNRQGAHRMSGSPKAHRVGK